MTDIELLAHNQSQTENLVMKAVLNDDAVDMQNKYFRDIDFTAIHRVVSQRKQVNTFAYANFKGSMFISCNFEGMQLHDTVFDGVTMDNCRFGNVSMASSSWQDAKVTNTNFSASHIVNMRSEYSQFNFCKFVLSNVRYSVFHNANLRNSNFANANLFRAKFDSADLSWTDLSYAECVDTSFRNAIFECSNARMTVFFAANFSAANMSAISDEYANYTRALFNEDTVMSEESRASIGERLFQRAAALLSDEPRRAVEMLATYIIRKDDWCWNDWAACDIAGKYEALKLMSKWKGLSEKVVEILNNL